MLMPMTHPLESRRDRTAPLIGVCKHCKVLDTLFTCSDGCGDRYCLDDMSTTAHLCRFCADVRCPATGEPVDECTCHEAQHWCAPLGEMEG